MGTRSTLRVWDFATGRQLHQLDIRGAAFKSVFLPDGRRAIVASGDKTIYAWDTFTGQPIGQLRGHAGAVFGLSLTRNGKILASASEDGTVRFWDTKEGQELHRIQVSGREVRAVALSPDGLWA